MKKLNTGNLMLLILLVFAALSMGRCRSGNFTAEQRDRIFNENWKFIRDSLPVSADQSTPDKPEFIDSAWITLDLPHDWSIATLPGNESDDQIGPFSKQSPGITSTGYVMGGTAWYRKHFKTDKADAGKNVTLRFDGVYMETEVWVNGKVAGNHVYGYTPFYFDITSLLNEPGADNVIAVRVSNTGRNSRWYSGSGIFRNVFLTVTDPVHIPVWGVQVTASEISETSATTGLNVTLQNSTAQDVNASVRISILPPGSQVEVGSAEGEIVVGAQKYCIIQPAGDYK